MDDASVVQSAQVAPQWGQVGGVRSAVSCARVEHFCKGHALGPYDHEGVASPGAAGRHQSGYPHARSLGEQRDETLVLDEVDAAASGGAVSTSVPGHPPQRREQLGIPSVAPVDLDEQRPVSIAPLEQHDPGSLHRCRSEDVDEHAELGESRLDPRLGRQPARRPVHEVDDGGSQRADGEGTNGAGRRGCLHEQRGHQLAADEPSTEVAERSAEVWRGRRDRRRGDDQGARREHRGTIDVAEQLEHVAGVVHHEGGDDGCRQQGDDERSEDVPCQGAAAAEHGDAEEHDRIDQRRPEGDPPQRFEEAGQRVEEFDDARFESAGNLGESDADRHRHRTDDRHRHVGWSAGSRFGLGRRVQLEPAAEHTPRLTGGHRVRHVRIIWLSTRGDRGSSAGSLSDSTGR